MNSAPQIQHGTPALVFAPMEGVVDAPMRALFSELGGFDFCLSEFLRVSQEVPPVRTFRDHVPELQMQARTAAGLPVQLQLLGGDPEKLAAAALRGIDAGATAIDLNFGCPAPTVNRHDGGAALLRFPERIRLIVQAVRSAVPVHLPVSAKLRLGWDDMNAIHRNAEMAAEGGASWITIHGRTKIQGYTPPAYWGPIGEVRRRLSIPVVANGEIWTAEDLRRCREETGCEHFMLGRGAMSDPFLVTKARRELGLASEKSRLGSVGTGSTQEAEVSTNEIDWYPIFRRFSELCTTFTDRAGYPQARIKQWAGMIHRRTPLPGYDDLKRLQTLEEILHFLERTRPKTFSPN